MRTYASNASIIWSVFLSLSVPSSQGGLGGREGCRFNKFNLRTRVSLSNLHDLFYFILDDQLVESGLGLLRDVCENS